MKQVFKVQRGWAAGCVVTDGRVTRTRPCPRFARGGTPVFDGKMSTLRRYTEDVNEVRNGLECGIRLGEFDEYEEGDIIECYELEKLEQNAVSRHGVARAMRSRRTTLPHRPLGIPAPSIRKRSASPTDTLFLK